MLQTTEQSKLVRGITLWQPWAGLIANQVKEKETRTWSTAYQGIILIHAARRSPLPSELEPFSEYLHNIDLHKDLGKIVAVSGAMPEAFR